MMHVTILPWISMACCHWVWNVKHSLWSIRLQYDTASMSGSHIAAPWPIALPWTNFHLCHVYPMAPTHLLLLWDDSTHIYHFPIDYSPLFPIMTMFYSIYGITIYGKSGGDE